MGILEFKFWILDRKAEDRGQRAEDKKVLELDFWMIWLF